MSVHPHSGGHEKALNHPATSTGGDVCPVIGAAPCVLLPEALRFDSVDSKYLGKGSSENPPLGALKVFEGSFLGNGFNTIFRPNNSVTPTQFPKPVSPAEPATPNDATLELNLTVEQLSFTPPVGSVPNRGLNRQEDVFLNGKIYIQTVNDVANIDTGKRDGAPVLIHIESGFWVHIPATGDNPVAPESLCRMGSIPHGTTINAQGEQPPAAKPGPPKIPVVNITPFVAGSSPPSFIPFPSQAATNNDTARLPQDLSKFIAAGTITQDLLDDPNTLLRKAIEGQNIVSHVTFTVSTKAATPEIGGGTANIGFLTGAATGAAQGPNALVTEMEATFWQEEVEYEITVPHFHIGPRPLQIQPKKPNDFAPVPTFEIAPPFEISKSRTIKVRVMQIQYSQLVLFNFKGLSWPHRSVATLVPENPIRVPDSALKIF